MAESSLNWQPEEPDGERITADKPSRHLIVIAVGASLLLHGVIGSALLLAWREQPVAPVLSAVRINLVPSNPLNEMLQPAEPATESAMNDTEVLEATSVNEPSIADSAIPEPLSPPSLSLPPPEPEPDAVAVSDPAPSTASDAPGQPVISLPNLLSVQQSVQAVNADAAARSWLYECNFLEEESGFRTCAPGSGADSGYQEVERNAIYEGLNPVRERSRTERSLRTVYANTASVAAALHSGTVPEGMATYMLEQLEAGTSVYTNNGTDRVQHMRRMVDRSAAALMAERVLGDPWVRGRAVELQQRKVHAD